MPTSKVALDPRLEHRNIIPPCANTCPIGITNSVIIKKLIVGRMREEFEILDDYALFRYSCCGMVCHGL